MRTDKTDKIPRLSNRQIKRESDEDSSSSSPREFLVEDTHTNPRNQTPRRPSLARTSKAGDLPRLSTRQTKRESDEDSSSSSSSESSASSSHTNPRSNKQSANRPVFDVFKLDEIFNKGNAEDQFKCGQMLYDGNGVDMQGYDIAQNYVVALNWFHRAADQHHPEAQYKLGEMYATGLGTEKNEDRALAWYLAAAGQDHAKAQYEIGNMYFNGRGVEKDLSKALKFYEKAAAQGLPEAQ
jgi:TPR repeat protein